MIEMPYPEIRKAALAEMAGAACLKLGVPRVNLLADPVWGVWTCRVCGRSVAGLVTCNDVWCGTCTQRTERGPLVTYVEARRAAGRYSWPKGIVLPSGIREADQRACRRLLIEEMDRRTYVWRA